MIPPLLDSRCAPAVAFVLALVVATAGCSGDGDPMMNPDGGGASTVQAPCPEGFLPLRPGIKWTYLVKDLTDGNTTTKMTTVGNLEAVDKLPGVMAYRIRTQKGLELADETVSWQNVTETGVERYQEQSYRPGVAGAAPTPRILEWWSPYKLRLDTSAEHLILGARWTVTYTENSLDHETMMMTTRERNDQWSVEGVNVPLAVAGKSYSTLVVRRIGTDQGATSDKKYWFACGVGKVKETGGQIEELQSVEGL